MEQKKEPQIVLIKKGSGSPPATVTNLGGRSLKTGLANYVDGARTYESILVKGEHVFVFFEDQNFWTANLLDKNNRSIIPSRPHCKFADLPDTFSLKTKEELYELVFKEVEDYCGLKPALCHLISAFVILSYTQDFFNVLPILNLYGTTRSGKTACFILIRELAYRSVLETNMTAANILEHCNKGRTADNQYTSCGTILEDEVDSIDTEKLHVLKSDSKWHSQSRILNKNGTRVQNTAQSFGLKLLAGEHLAGTRLFKDVASLDTLLLPDHSGL